MVELQWWQKILENKEYFPKRPGTSTIQQADVSIESKVFSLAAEVVEYIQTIELPGWLQLTDAVLQRIEGQTFEDVNSENKRDLNGSYILSGEFGDKNQSIHIRYEGDVWKVYTYKFSFDDGEYLVQRQTLARIPRGSLFYNVVWHKEDANRKPVRGDSASEFVWRPFMACFVGLETGK